MVPPSSLTSFSLDSAPIVVKPSVPMPNALNTSISNPPRTPVVVSPIPQLSRSLYNAVPSGIGSAPKVPSYKKVESVMGMDRPAILEEAMETNATDLAAPISVSKLESNHPRLQSRMWRYYHSMVDTHKHLEAVPTPLVSRNSFEPPALHYAGDACVMCGNRSISSCKYRRCRNCCNGSSKSCAVHAIGHDPSFVLPRPLERTGIPGTLASAQTGVSKTIRKSAPPLPRATSSNSAHATSHGPSPSGGAHPSQSTTQSSGHFVRLGEVEATNPWLELKDEAQFRHFQNATCMENIFDHHSTDTLATWLQQWQPTSLESLKQKLHVAQQDISNQQDAHNTRMDTWIESSRLFKQRLAQLDAISMEHSAEDLQLLRDEFLSKIDAHLPVPITPRKRPAPDPNPELDPKRKSTGP